MNPPISIRCELANGVCEITTGGRSWWKMPPDAISLVTTGLGVSVLAGIISGVCYMLAHGIGTRRRARKKKPEWYCEICGTYLHSTENILNQDLVTCVKCGAKVCTARCAKFVQHTRWVCQNCLKPSESWFRGILKAIQPNTEGFPGHFGTMMNPEPQPNPNLDSLRKLEKEQVRDFIEKLVNVMLGENVDNASVSMLYNDKHYLPITGQSPCTAHAALKQLIEKLLKEAVNLPLLAKAHAHPVAPAAEDTTNGTYEDLLATAIINKVITGCQNNLPSSSANSVSSRLSSSSRTKEDKEYFFGEETLDTKWKTTDLDTTSVSSLEEWLQSESSFGSRKRVDKVTLMIKQDIEEVDNFDSENDSDDTEYFRSSSSLLNDGESNWFLQKRQFQGTHSPVPVPMLVPDPATEAKVLIGDKPLDDTSDLSDVGSDYEESVQPHTTHSLLVQSKNLIGGGKNFEIVETADVQSEASSTDSGVKEVNGKEQQSFDVVPEPGKTDISLDDDNIEDSSFISVYSNTEKEAEYTEKYASLPRQIIMKTSTPQRHGSNNSKDSDQGNLDETSSDFEFVGGNYSKREKEKWKHAVEMSNNPYSKESIERRIERSNSDASSIFGPDYYARLAGKPSGGGKLSAEVNGVSWPPPEQPRSPSPPPPELPKVAPPPRPQQVEIAITPKAFLISDSLPDPPKTAPPPLELVETDGIHQALKAIVTPVEEKMPSNSFVVSSYEAKSVHHEQVVETYVTSDSDLSYTNFYDVEHAQVVRKSKNEDVQIPITAPPVAKPRVLTNQNKKENGLYVKAAGAIKQRNLPASEKPVLRRHLSESSLLDEYFDAAPKVMHQKKDNTLISKIYKDPKVRLFALHSREETPGRDGDYIKPTFQSQRSFDAKLAPNESYLSKGKFYNSSDDGITSEYESGKTGKMSFFSSEEDLLSLHSESSYRPVATKNERVQLTEDHFISDTRTPSPFTPKTLSTRKFIYGSQEDLLSVDEVSSIPRRKDNTIISKIYQNANVRSFALKTHSRDFILDYEPTTPTTLKPHHTTEIQKRPFINKYRSYDELSSADISLENYDHHEENINNEVKPSLCSNGQDVEEDGYKSEDLDIDEVAKRHVVRQALGKFSKSEVNVGMAFQRVTSLEDGENVRVSVRDLRKKFESNDATNKPVISSLTARSLSKQVKESLKQ